MTKSARTKRVAVVGASLCMTLLAACGKQPFFDRSAAPLVSPSALPHQGASNLASITELRVWDGVCPNNSTPFQCGDLVSDAIRDDAGVYRLTARDRRVTVDVALSNPRVRDRYLKLTITYSWLPTVYSGGADREEFGVLYGDRSEIRERYSFDASSWPADAGLDFVLSERGLDIPAQVHTTTVPFRLVPFPR